MNNVMYFENLSYFLHYVVICAGIGFLGIGASITFPWAVRMIQRLFIFIVHLVYFGTPSLAGGNAGYFHRKSQLQGTFATRLFKNFISVQWLKLN